MKGRLIDKVNHEYLLCILFYLCQNAVPKTKRKCTSIVNYHIRLSTDIAYFQTWKEDFKEAVEEDSEDLKRAYRYVAKYWPDKYPEGE
jgi:hypothetical protein